MAVVMFPLWPIKLRVGVWYLSMGMLGLIGLFFAMAIFRAILFGVTYFAVPPGLWLYPNLFEDVGFFDSFRPLWGWQEVSTSSSEVISLMLTSCPGQEEEGQEEQGRCRRCRFEEIVENSRKGKDHRVGSQSNNDCTRHKPEGSRSQAED